MIQMFAKLLKPLKRIHFSEKNHLFFWMGLAFWAGCLLAGCITKSWWLYLLLAGSLVLFAVMALKGIPVETALIPAVIVIAMLYTLPRLGFDAPPAGYYPEITGYIYGEPKIREDKRITFTLGDYSLGDRRVRGKAYCSVYLGKEEVPLLFDGAKITFSGKLYIPGEKSGEPRFDFRRWLMTSPMDCGMTIDETVTVLNSPETAPWKDWAWRLRSSIIRGLEGTMGSEAGLAAAVLLGQKEEISEVDYANFKNMGVSHVLAVSGLHVAILGLMVQRLLRRFIKNPLVCLGVLAVFLLGYSGMVGFTPSSLRASFMLLINECCCLNNRKRDRLTVYGIALLLILLIDPLKAGSAGFVLSFSAVGGIVLFLPGLLRAKERLLPTKDFRCFGELNIWHKVRWALNRCIHFLADTLLTSFTAQVGTLLPVLYFYRTLPVYGLFVNVLVVPYMGLLLPVYLIALLTCWIPFVGVGTGFAAAFMSRGLTWTLGLLNRLPNAVISCPAPSIWQLILCSGILLCFSGILRAGWKQRMAAVTALTVIAGVSFWIAREPENRYVQLSVGQGDAAMLFAGKSTVGIDVGADGSATMDYLNYYGRNLDALFLTHLHMDHAGGVTALLENGYTIGKVYLPVGGDKQALDEECLAILDVLEREQVPVCWLAAGDRLEFGDVVVDVLWPYSDKLRTGQDANDLPLVLMIDLAGAKLLNTADLTGHYEKYSVQPCDVLKVAHHGSKDSTGEEFLMVANPSAAIITCASNRNLPSPETLLRLAQQQIPYYRTDETGDITIWTDKNGVVLSPYRK